MIKFGTGGFRGIIGNDFTEENLIIIMNSVAQYIINNNLKRIVPVSYDFRFKSKESANLIANELSKKGIKVILSDSPTPTPCVMYYVKNHNLDFGIMVTASHNPKDYNGVKFFETGGLDTSVLVTNEIERLIETQELAKISKESIEVVDIVKPYLDFLKTFIDISIGAKNKILFDPIHGTGAVTIPYFKDYYKLVNFDSINLSQDYNFGGMLPNPTYHNLLKDRDLQIKNNYEIVLGTDSDADRLGILDENGDYIDNNDILAALYYYLVKYRNQVGDIVKNLTTSNLIDAVANKLGFKCHTVDVGFKNISHKMLEVDALIGGESSGGLTIRNYIMGKDSTLSALLIIEMITKTKQTISNIIKEVRDFAGFYSKYYEDEIHYKNKNQLIDAIENKILKGIDYERLEKYGSNYKLFLKGNDWIVLRFSGTEAILRVVMETEDEKLARKYMKEIIEGLNDFNGY